MNRQELAALRDALDALLAWPDGVLVQMARWLADVTKPNGRDPHPPPVLTSPPRTVKVKAARRAKPTSAQATEQKLLTALQDNPGLSVVALANAAASSRSATGERLRQLALRGIVEKDLTGRWKLKGEEPRPPDPPQPSPS